VFNVQRGKNGKTSGKKNRLRTKRREGALASKSVRGKPKVGTKKRQRVDLSHKKGDSVGKTRILGPRGLRYFGRDVQFV